LVVSVGFLCGCTSNVPPTSSKSAFNINVFASAKEGDLIRFYFTLEDEDGINTVSDGSATINIYDEDNKNLYTQQFEVSSSDFMDYGYKITGTGIGKAYEWRIPLDNIEKGSSSFGFGTATLVFVTPEGLSLNAEDNLVQIPTYSEEELENISENNYEDNAKSINKKITKGIFSVTVTRAGYFTEILYGISTEYYRIDMVVENIGSESEYFMPSGVVLIDDSNKQYDYTYGGTLNTFSTVYADSQIDGYLLFDDIPKTVSINKLSFELGYDESFSPYLFEFNLN